MAPTSMNDISPPSLPNTPEYTVSELSQTLKRAVEETFPHVRVRGEVSGFKRAASGHLYLSLKDESAVLDAVCWRGTAARLAIRPEDGLEVIATGRLTTYPGRSRYQIVIEQIEIAGEGALLKLLEERRKKLAAEGLFDEVRKKPLPFLPAVVGVVTSPTGAVIRDILHRLNDRFPRHVLMWPVLVQGDGAAEQIAAAIRGFNALSRDTAPSRPDVLIVARGGGSLEDLWAFNEEVVVRAAAESAIPLISAVGHETDTTLIDFASDRRAPTPTAAAEMAVPVRAELMATVLDLSRRLLGGMTRTLEDRRVRVDGLARGLPDPERLLETKTQHCDLIGERLQRALETTLTARVQALDAKAGRLRSPIQIITTEQRRIQTAVERLSGGFARSLSAAGQDLERIGSRLTPPVVTRAVDRSSEQLARISFSLESLSYHRVLERGYAVVRDGAGMVVESGDQARSAGAISVQFGPDDFADASVQPGTGKPGAPRRRPSPSSPGGEDPQGSLL